MTTGEDQIETPTPSAPVPARPDNVRALLVLVPWFVIPFVLIMGLWYAEPWIQGDRRVERTNTVTRQEVHPYPIPSNAPGQSFAPPAVPRAAPPVMPTLPRVGMPDVPVTEIVAKPVDQPQAVYPTRALEAEREGIVRMKVTIAPDGSVTDVVVMQAQPPGWFEQSAVSAVRRWRYQPPGRTIETQVEIEFRLH
jgi:TonB family protein